MIELQTPRLLVVSTPLEVLERRLSHDAFEADVSFGKETLRMYFPPQWPGDALPIFSAKVQQMKSEPGTAQWGATIIDRIERVAVGQLGFKAPPDKHGCVELGYGINPTYQNRGYATEAAQALVIWALGQQTVGRVTAECLEENWASVRVLEKIGFQRAGHRKDEEGLLLLWVYPC